MITVETPTLNQPTPKTGNNLFAFGFVVGIMISASIFYFYYENLEKNEPGERKS